MPSVFTHFLILDEVINQLPQKVADIARQHKEYSYWGSVGPDYFYFFEQDWSLAGKLAGFTFKLYDQLEEVVDIYKTASAFRSSVTDWISGGLTGEIEGIAKRFEVIINSLVVTFLSKGVDLFEEFTPPISKDASVSKVNDWWLADLAHQRRTVDFSRSLWDHSRGNPRLEAYTLGYLTHVGGDASGHPLVNMIVGGPCRTQWRRHGLIEKAQDTHYWNKYRGQRVSDSHAHKLIEMEKPSSPTLLPDMPEDLIDLISNAINKNYSEFNLKNGLPDRDSINNMYRLYYRYLRSSSTLGGVNMPPPEDFDWYDLPEWVRDQLQDTWDKRPTKGLPSISDPTNLGQWKSLISGIVRSVLWLSELVIKIATLPQAIVARLGTAPARYLLWLMEKALYEAYRDIRSGLALAAFIHPEPEQVQRHFSAIVNPSDRDWNIYLEAFGFAHYTNGDQTYHLVHPFVFNPTLPKERPYERPVPRFPDKIRAILKSGDPSAGDEALSRLLFDADLYDGVDALYESGARFNPINGVPQQAPNLDVPLPSAVAASLELIRYFRSNGAAGLKNINLDGDRGYIWPTWESTKTSDKWQQYSDFKFGDW